MGGHVNLSQQWIKDSRCIYEHLLNLIISQGVEVSYKGYDMLLGQYDVYEIMGNYGSIKSTQDIVERKLFKVKMSFLSIIHHPKYIISNLFVVNTRDTKVQHLKSSHPKAYGSSFRLNLVKEKDHPNSFSAGIRVDLSEYFSGNQIERNVHYYGVLVYRISLHGVSFPLLKKNEYQYFATKMNFITNEEVLKTPQYTYFSNANLQGSLDEVLQWARGTSEKLTYSNYLQKEFL